MKDEPKPRAADENWLKYLRRIAVVLAEEHGDLLCVDDIRDLLLDTGQNICDVPSRCWTQIFKPAGCWQAMRYEHVTRHGRNRYLALWRYIGPSKMMRDLCSRTAPPVLQPEEVDRLSKAGD